VVDLEGHAVAVADRDEVALAGGGNSAAEGDATGEACRDTMHWFRPPADECPLDPWWGVTEIADPLEDG
jgi:hypothetical protein